MSRRLTQTIRVLLVEDHEVVREGLRAHFAAGATHVCIQPVHEDGDTAARDRILTELANT